MSVTPKDTQEYKVLTDEQLIKRIRGNDGYAMEYIINKYKNLVKVKARTYFIMGADKEDIIQEGMIGLYKAIRDFDVDKEVSFFTFAELCITRQMITAIKSATRQKHIPMNSYLSLNKTVYDDEGEKTFMDELIENSISNPEELLIGKEERIYIEKNMEKALSELEHKVLSLYLDGNSYVEIGEKISKDEKSIDNALQRVRKKVEKILQEKNLHTKTDAVKV